MECNEQAVSARTARLKVVLWSLLGTLAVLGAPVPSAFAQSTSGAAELSRLGVAGPLAKDKARAEKLMRRMGILGPKTRLSASLLVRSGQMEPAQSRMGAFAVATPTPRPSTGPLGWRLEGFTAQQTSELGSFLSSAYRLMVGVYGLPAPSQRGRVVRILSTPTAGDGFYAPPEKSAPSPNGGVIYYTPLLASDFSGGGQCDSACQAAAAVSARQANSYNLSRQMLLAFRGSQLTAFDAWDLGMADAAALIVNFQAQGSPRSFDPSLLGAYALPIYDFLNQGEVGNAAFFTPGSSSAFLLYARSSLAQAAWLKAWVENPAFFSRFNTLYYSRYTPALARDAAALQGVAASAQPTVEGLGFNDWARRQRILHVQARPGEKLWAYVSPFTSIGSGPTSFYGLAFHYRTDSAGREFSLNGVGTVQAFDETGRDITRLSPQLARDNRLYFEGGQAEVNGRDPNLGDDEVPVSSFNSTGTPNSGRIRLLFRVSPVEASALVPHNVRGSDSRPSGFYGVATGTQRGRVSISVGTAASVGEVVRGAFGTASTYPSGPRVQASILLSPTDGGVARVFKRNLAWSYADGVAQGAGFVLETVPSNAAVLANWRRSGSNVWRLVSIPVFPLESDEARVLSAPPSTLSLARYRPTDLPVTNLGTSFRFGIGSDKHDFYPAISEPMEPGRAYWYRLPADRSVAIRGGEPSRTRPFEVPLRSGWNAVGVPFNMVFALQSVRVRLGASTSASWSDAVARGWVGTGVWRWKPEGGYARVDAGAGTALAPFEGYYVYTSLNSGVSLVFDPLSRSGALPAASGGWQVPLSVLSGTAREDGFSFGCVPFAGTTPSRRAAARPPAGERSLLLSFAHSGSAATEASRAGRESGWAESFAPPLSATQTFSWRFLVDGAAAGERVVLTWGEVSTVPATHTLTLVDETTGVRTPMRVGGARAYAFVAGPAGRRLRIEAAPRSSQVTS
jgi:hypothetical protein